MMIVQPARGGALLGDGRRISSSRRARRSRCSPRRQVADGLPWRSCPSAGDAFRLRHLQVAKTRARPAQALFAALADAACRRAPMESRFAPSNASPSASAPAPSRSPRPANGPMSSAISMPRRTSTTSSTPRASYAADARRNRPVARAAAVRSARARLARAAAASNRLRRSDACRAKFPSPSSPASWRRQDDAGPPLLDPCRRAPARAHRQRIRRCRHRRRHAARAAARRAAPRRTSSNWPTAASAAPSPTISCRRSTALLAREPKPEHILIETSGLALPKPLVKAFDWPEIALTR